MIVRQFSLSTPHRYNNNGSFFCHVHALLSPPPRPFIPPRVSSCLPATRPSSLCVGTASLKWRSRVERRKTIRLPIFDPLFDLGVPTILAIFSSQPFHRSNRELITRPFSNSNNYFLRSRRGSNRGGWVAVPSSPFFFFFLFFVGAVINYYTGQRRKKGRRGRSRSGWRKRELAAREVNRNGKKKDK